MIGSEDLRDKTIKQTVIVITRTKGNIKKHKTKKNVATLVKVKNTSLRTGN